jgi:hypothetical protein
VQIMRMEAPGANALLQSPALATLTWVERNQHLWIATRTPDTSDTTYITMNEVTPVWQLMDGWYGFEAGYRWAAPRATARLYRAQRATQFEVVANVGPQILPFGHTDLSVRLDGVLLGTARLTELGSRIVRWPLPPGPTGTVEVEFQAEPAFHASSGDPRVLGEAIMSFGFLPSGR